MMNIMDTLTPQPPFDPARKNEAVRFPPFGAAVGMKAPSKIINGINRTKN